MRRASTWLSVWSVAVSVLVLLLHARQGVTKFDVCGRPGITELPLPCLTQSLRPVSTWARQVQLFNTHSNSISSRDESLFIHGPFFQEQHLNRPVIISCAVTGGGDTTASSPYVPVTPEQIANDALAAREAGAAIVHIHVRNPVTGKPSRDPELYREVVQRIRSSGSDLLINLTTGAGGRFVPDSVQPNQNAVVDGMATPQARIEHVLELRPEICSLDVGTVNFSRYAFVNVPDHVEQMAKAIREAGVKPELEVFDLGHAAYARHLHNKGYFADPPWIQLCLGVSWGAPATVDAMMAMKQMVPNGGCWSAFGISSQQFSMVAQAVLLGGHVRVGLEDNLYLRKGELSKGNAPLVERAALIIRELDAEVATPEQARNILRIG
jgi:uncharacterized protein (DUF849 family)